MEIALAAPIALSGFTVDNPAITPANITITADKTNKVAIVLLNDFLPVLISLVDTNNPVKTIVTADREADAAAKFLGSIMAKPAKAIAKTAIATDRAIIVCLAFLEYLLTTIKPAKTPPIADIAAIAFSISLVSKMLIIAIDAAINKNAAPIFIIIVPALSAFFPPNLDIAINPVTIPPRAAITPMPLSNPSLDIPAIIFIAIAIKENAPDTLSIKSPALSAYFPPNLDIATKPVIIPLKIVITIRPLNSPSYDVPPIIFIARPIIANAPATLSIKLPACSIVLSLAA